MPAPTPIEKDLPLYNVIDDSVTSSAMATPSLLQIDDRNPLVFYSPNSSWTRGGAASDFDGTSTFTATTGASATLTFTGSEISVWGTIQFLQPNTTTYVVSSYSIDNGSTTIFNATESAGFQFQQKLFQSARLNESISHTIVVTLVNNGTYFIDYFLIVPSDATTSTSASSLASSSATDSSSTAGAVNGSQSHSSRVSLGPVVGGTLGGLALLIIAILAFLLCCKKRRKDKNRMLDDSQVSLDLLVTPASRPMPMQQHQPHEASDRVSEHQPHLQHPTSLTSSLRITPSGPSSKAAPLYILSPPGDSPPVTDSHSPPGYEE